MTIHDYINSLPATQSDSVHYFYHINLDYGQSLDLLQNIWASGLHFYTEIEGLDYYQQTTNCWNPVMKLTNAGLTFWEDRNPRKVYFIHIGIPLEKFRSMLLAENIDYDKRTVYLSDFAALNTLYHWVIDNGRMFVYGMQSEHYKIADSFTASFHFCGYSEQELTTINIIDGDYTVSFKVKS